MLSFSIDTVVPVALPGITTSVRLTRGEFDDMLRPAIGETVAATRRVLDSAGVDPADLSAIVLVGGSSRIPLVSEMLSAEFGRPLALDNHPKHDVALGAAIRGTAAARPAAARPASAPAAAAAGGRGAAGPRPAAATGPATGPAAQAGEPRPPAPRTAPPAAARVPGGETGAAPAMPRTSTGTVARLAAARRPSAR